MGSDLITIHRERVVPTDGHGEQQGVACQGLTIECLWKMTHHCHPCPKRARADRLPALLALARLTGFHGFQVLLIIRQMERQGQSEHWSILVDIRNTAEAIAVGKYVVLFAFPCTS